METGPIYDASGAVTSRATFKYVRDSTDIAFYRLQSVLAASATVTTNSQTHGFSLLHMDPVAAGTYTYKLSVIAEGASVRATCRYAKLVAIEL